MKRNKGYVVIRPMFIGLLVFIFVFGIAFGVLPNIPQTGGEVYAITHQGDGTEFPFYPEDPMNYEPETITYNRNNMNNFNQSLILYPGESLVFEAEQEGSNPRWMGYCSLVELKTTFGLAPESTYYATGEISTGGYTKYFYDDITLPEDADYALRVDKGSVGGTSLVDNNPNDGVDKTKWCAIEVSLTKIPLYITVNYDYTGYLEHSTGKVIGVDTNPTRILNPKRSQYLELSCKPHAEAAHFRYYEGSDNTYYVPPNTDYPYGAVEIRPDTYAEYTGEDAQLTITTMWNSGAYDIHYATMTWHTNGGIFDVGYGVYEEPIQEFNAYSYSTRSAALNPYLSSTPTKEGATFKGWYGDESFTKGPYTTIDSMTGWGENPYAYHLYARWEESGPVHGTWGTCPWELDENGVLTVSPGVGTNTVEEGYNYNNSPGRSPWTAYADRITQVNFVSETEGLTTNYVVFPEVVNNLLCNMHNLESVDFSGVDASNCKYMNSFLADYSNNGNKLEAVDLSEMKNAAPLNMRAFFDGCQALESVTFKDGGDAFDTSDVQSFNQTFTNCFALATIPAEDIDTSSAINMACMFQGCRSLTVDPSTWDLSKANDVSYMFRDCVSMDSIELPSGATSGTPASSALTTMEGMFSGCSSLATISGLNFWTTSNVTNMNSLFEGCQALTALGTDTNHGLPTDTSSVVKMKRMFKNCSSLETLDLNSFDTGNVEKKPDVGSNETGMAGMFDGCSSLAKVTLGSDFTFYGKDGGTSTLGTLPVNQVSPSHTNEWWVSSEGQWSTNANIAKNHLNKSEVYKKTPDLSVTFEMSGKMEAPESQTVESGGKATEPLSPAPGAHVDDYAESGLTLRNWYTKPIDENTTNKDISNTNTNGGTIFDFNNTEITGNTTIYAGYEGTLNVYSYDTTNGDLYYGGLVQVYSPYQSGFSEWTSNIATTVLNGTKYRIMQKPDGPYEFIGWSTSTSANDIISTSTYYEGVFTGRKTMYALYKEVEYITTVDIGNIWTKLDPVNKVAFTAEIHDEEDEDGINFNEKLEIEREYWQNTDYDKRDDEVRSDKGSGKLKVNNTYRYSIVIKAKPGWVFKSPAAAGVSSWKQTFKFIYGGTKKTLSSVVYSEDFKTIYIGPLDSQTFTIDPVDITKATITGISNKTFTGSAQSQKPTVKVKVNGTTFTLKEGTDYSLSYKANTNVGTATVTITGKGNYTGKITKEFKINPASISKAAVSGIKASYSETKKEIKPTPTVKLNNKALKAGTDYTVAYKNNVKVGTATVTITGKGNYTGTVTKTFSITKVAPTGRRLAGANRFGTANAIAKGFMTDSKQSRLQGLIVANGFNPPDALSAGALSAKLNLPIQMVDKTAGSEADLVKWIKNNVQKNKTIYIVGGPAAVRTEFETAVKKAGYKATRVSGNDRIGTNLEVLKKVQLKKTDTLLVAEGSYKTLKLNGKNKPNSSFHEALIASATGKPLLLVQTGGLTNEQKAFLSKNKVDKIVIIGKESSVSATVETQLKQYANSVERVKGANPDEISVAVAKKFWPNGASQVFLATSNDFADALTGGAECIVNKGPIFLVNDKQYAKTQAYLKTIVVRRVTALGGKFAISPNLSKTVTGVTIPE